MWCVCVCVRACVHACACVCVRERERIIAGSFKHNASIKDDMGRVLLK